MDLCDWEKYDECRGVLKEIVDIAGETSIHIGLEEANNEYAEALRSFDQSLLNGFHKSKPRYFCWETIHLDAHLERVFFSLSG